MKRARIASASLAVAVIGAGALAPPSGAVHRFGTKTYVDPPVVLISPLAAVGAAAGAAYTSAIVTGRCRAGVTRPVPASQLTPNKLASLMMAITWYEGTGVRSTNETPNPMTQSRNDVVGPTSVPPPQLRDSRATLYWHPGIGMWQLDDQGLGSLYARSRFTAYSAGIIARRLAGLFCDSNGSLTATFGEFRAYDLAASRRVGEVPAERKCDRAFRDIYNPRTNRMRGSVDDRR